MPPSSGSGRAATLRFGQLFLIAIGLLGAAETAGQTQVPAVLPAALHAHLTGETLGLVTSIRGTPLGVRDALQSLFGSRTLDMAEPGAAFQEAGANGTFGLPTRRLVSAGCSQDHCLIYYERGGKPRSWRVVLFRWTPAGTRLEWGSTAPGGPATIDQIKRDVLTGRLRTPATSW